nr:unnamed protein product [Spirometra erinaceieuropaei]
MISRAFKHASVTASLIYIWSRYHKKKRSEEVTQSIKCVQESTLPGEFTEIVEDLSCLPEAEAQTTLCGETDIQAPVSIIKLDTQLCEQSAAPHENIIEETILPQHVAAMSSVPDSTVKGLAALSMSDNPEANVISTVNHEDCDMSGSDMSEEVITPNSSRTESTEEGKPYEFPEGIFDDPDHDIVEDSPEVLGGKKIPRVLVPSDLWAEAVEKDTWRETFYVPASMGGVLIGRFGKNVRELKNQWNAEFSLNMCPGRQDTLLLKLSCPIEYKENVIHWITSRFKMRPSQTTIGNPNQLRRTLPLGDVTPVRVRSLYGLKEFFVTIKDKEFDRYVAMQEELDKDYASLNSSRMQLYEPVTSGTVAVLPHNFGFARALILKVLLTWPRQAVCFLLDHGTFGVVALSELRKIKAKYMRVPFQAIHVSWAHALPVYCDVPDLHILRTFFSSNKTYAYAVRRETCCRASVAFLEQVSDKKPPSYIDKLALACQSGLYMVSPLGLFPSRQMWVNRTKTPYYPCPHSEIDYTQLVEYYSDESYGAPQPLATGQSQNMPGKEVKPLNSNNANRAPNNTGRGRGFRRFAGQARRFRAPGNANQNTSQAGEPVGKVTRSSSEAKPKQHQQQTETVDEQSRKAKPSNNAGRKTYAQKRTNQPNKASTPASAPSSSTQKVCEPTEKHREQTLVT